MKDRISILLINYNRLDYLKGTLETIQANTCTPHELIIWDNGSTEPGIKEFLHDFSRNEANYAKVFFSPKNIGVWRASNELIARAHCPETNGFVKMDNDVKVLTKGWLDKWIDCCKINPEVGMIGANIEGKKERSNDTEILNLNGHRLLGLKEEGTGGAVYVPGSVFSRVGYYNEDYGIYGQGDKDYARRVTTNGKKFVYHRETQFGRFAVNNDDMTGGYREHKNLYVRRNRRLYILNRYMYQNGHKELGIWYERYPSPREARTAQNFQWTENLTPKIAWETGRITKEVRELIEKFGLQGIKK